MKKENVSISSPDELDKHLQSSSPIIWIVLGAVIMTMLGFFVWSCIYQIPIKLTGTAFVNAGQATLNVEDKYLNKLEAGQKVYISNQEGLLSFDNENNPIVLNLTLKDGGYTYRTDIVIKKIHPIDFLIK